MSLREKEYVKDKLATINVLAGIIHSPLLLLDEKYPLTTDDFPERFHKIVYAAVEHLIKGGAQSIDAIDVDGYLSSYPDQHKVFTNNNGLEYIVQAIEITDSSNFPYYYNRLKKCALLNRLKEQGFDISEFYNPDVIGIEAHNGIQTKLDEMSIEEILASYELKFATVRDIFRLDGGRTGVQAATNMEALIERLKETPEFGLPMNSKKLTTICRGRRLKKFYLRTTPTGVGKTRLSLADACLTSVPRIYDLEQKKWIQTGCKEPTLYITTELEIDEIQTMILAYVACVPEDHILDGKYVDDEESRVNKAVEIIKEAPLWVEHMPQFNVDDIENLIKEYKLKHAIGYVFFDYLFSSIKILMEISKKTRGVNMREDNVLVMFSDRMKAACNNLNVHIDTSTQANGDWKTMKDPDQSIIRGSKGIADKVDIGYCCLEPTEKDIEAVKIILANSKQAFSIKPNLVYHIYKVRRGKINHAKLFVYFDYATLRTTDLFVTDKNYNLLNVENTDIEVILDQTEEETTRGGGFKW